MKYLLKTLLLGSLMLPISCSFAQSTRSLQGRLSLDVAPNITNRTIEISVRNHSFVVIPPAFTILRPIISTQSTVVPMPVGVSSVDYLIDGISTDAVDYSIQITCVGCGADFRTQYYSPSGNKYGLADAVYLDPDALPDQLNLNAITAVTISGKLVLETVSERELSFELSVYDFDKPQQVYQQQSIALPAGARQVDYAITGMNRLTHAASFGIRVSCTVCFGISRKTIEYPSALAASLNHQQIDFGIGGAMPVLVPSIYLLLNDD